jgi:hypothetical protein
VVRREEMERCIREVMGGDKFLGNAAVWKDKGQTAMAQGGSSDNNIKEFLRLLGSGSGSRKSSVS